jgi:perosamine synthetase
MSSLGTSLSRRWPSPDEEIFAALVETYRSGDWGRYHGAAGERLEALLAKQFHTRHALTTSSGTIAVELALRGLGVKAGDEVILAGYDFPGNFRCIEAIGARPVLVDLAPCSWRIDPEQVEAAIAPETKAIVASHLHGDLADMPALRRLADAAGIGLLEDACQAPGALIAGRPAGSWGDVGVLSFGGSKLLTAGRGGALLTDRDDVRQRTVAFRERGNDAFPLSELQASVLPPQLAKLDERNVIRERAAARLRKACRALELFQPVGEAQAGWSAAYYKMAWRVVDRSIRDGAGVGSAQIVEALVARGAPFGVGFRGFVRRGAGRCRRVGELENSRLASENTILLHHPVLLGGEEEIDLVAAATYEVEKDSI